MITISLGLGEDIYINVIIGLPTFYKWKIMFDVDDDKADSKSLNQYFDLSFKHAASGLPPGVIFQKSFYLTYTYLFYWKRFSYSISFFDCKPHYINKSGRWCDLKVKTKCKQYFY